MVRRLARSRLAAPLRVRDFRLLWSGSVVSSLGDGIFTVALALEALRLDPQPTGLSFVLAARAVPMSLLLVLGGVVVDRVPRRLAMLVADAVRGLAVALVAALVLLHLATLAALVVMAVVFGAADAFGNPASMAILPELVPTDLITQANALNNGSYELAQNLVGPATGGLVVGTLGTAASFGLDAGSFAVSALCLLGLGARERPQGAGGSLLQQAAQGFGFVLSRRWLLVLLLGAGLANVVGLGPYLVLLPVLVRETLHGSSLALGLVYACAGAAGVAASLVVAHLGSPRRLLETMWAAYGLSGLLEALMALSPDPWVAAALAAGSAGLVVYGDVLYFTRLERSVPKHLLGRVSSVSTLMTTTLMPLGMLLGGLLATGIGTRAALLGSGLAAASCGLVVLVPGARSLEAEPAAAG